MLALRAARALRLASAAGASVSSVGAIGIESTLHSRRACRALAAECAREDGNQQPTDSVRWHTAALAVGSAVGVAAAWLSTPFSVALSERPAKEIQEMNDALVDAQRRLQPEWAKLQRHVEREVAGVRTASVAENLYRQSWGVKVSLKGKSLSVRFPLRPGADLSTLLVNAVAETSRGDAAVVVKAWDSPVARQLSFVSSARGSGSAGLTMLVFSPLMGNSLQEIEFIKEGRLTDGDVAVVLDALRRSTEVSADYLRRGSDTSAAIPRRAPTGDLRRGLEKRHPWPSPDRNANSMGTQTGPVRRGADGESLERELSAMGAQVFPPAEGSREAAAEAYRAGRTKDFWGALAGYDEQKRLIEDTLLLAMLEPQIFSEIAKGTRAHHTPSWPKAVLFEGPPGTGKTSSARALARMAVAPLVYVPVESIFSKWYGDSERKLSKIFALCGQFEDGW